MHLTPKSIRCVSGGLLIEGTKGPVHIRRNTGRIEHDYQGNQLVNGNAFAYSEMLLKQAIKLTKQFPFAWHLDSNGTQRITNHKRFYEQTFNPELLGIETLRRWLSEIDFAEEKSVDERGTAPAEKERSRY